MVRGPFHIVLWSCDFLDHKPSWSQAEVWAYVASLYEFGGVFR